MLRTLTTNDQNTFNLRFDRCGCFPFDAFPKMKDFGCAIEIKTSRDKSLNEIDHSDKVMF